MSNGGRLRKEIFGDDRSEQESDSEKKGDKTVIMELCRKEIIWDGH